MSIIYPKGYTWRQVIRSYVEYFTSDRRKIRRGVFVEDCRYQVLKVKHVDVILDDVELEDGAHCSLWHCGLVVVNQ